MAIVRNFKLFLNAGSQIQLVIHANQYDSGEQWRFTLYNQDGSVYEPSSGAIVGIKSDGHGIINTGTVSGGKVVITETQQMTAAAGKAVFELMIDGGSHGTANFIVLVEPKPGDQADLSESDLSLIQEAINSTTPANIANAVSNWMDDNLAPSEWVIDSSLSTSGAAADAKKTGDEISELKSALDSKVEVASSDSDTVTLRYKSNGTNVLAPVPSAFAFDALKEQVDAGVTIPDHSITMAKTDFYYSGSLAKEYSWIYNYFSTYMRVMCKWTEMDTVLNEFPEKLSIVFVGVTDYWYSGGGNMSMATTSHTKSIPRAYNTITVDGVSYGILEFLRSDFETAYNELKTYVDNGESWKDAQFQVTNSATRVPSDTIVYFIAGEVTTELIEAEFSATVLSSDFVTAVKKAMGEDGGESSSDEEIVKNNLTGKVMINFGDSYTKNAGPYFSAIAEKYGMARDDQGWNGAQVTTHLRTYASDLVTAYTNGKVINGNTYTAEDVAIITFMGGANDGAGIDTWVGDGLHVTEVTKIYGACHYIFNLFATTFTNAKIIVISQPSNFKQSVSNYTTDAQAQALGFTSLAELQVLDDYQLSEYMMYQKEKAIMDAAKAYSFPLIDMFSEFPSMMNPANRTDYWQSDKIHVNSAGSKLIADAVDKKIIEVVTGNKISKVITNTTSGGGGLTDGQKNAILAAFNHVAWDDDDPTGQSWIDAVYAAFFDRVVTSLTAIFNSGSATIFAGASLDSLKQYLTVTASFSDGTTTVLSSSEYTLSGTVNAGTNVITVTYMTATTTFTVTATAGADITPSLANMQVMTNVEASYDASTDALSIATTAAGTYRGVSYPAITVESGYTYQISYDLEYTSGNATVGFRDTSNWRVYGRPEVATASGHYENASVLSDSVAAGKSLVPTVFVTYESNINGSAVFKNLKIYKYMEES